MTVVNYYIETSTVVGCGQNLQNSDPSKNPPGRKPYVSKTGNKHVFGPPGPSPARRRQKKFGLENILRQKKQNPLQKFQKSFEHFSKIKHILVLFP